MCLLCASTVTRSVAFITKCMTLPNSHRGCCRLQACNLLQQQHAGRGTCHLTQSCMLHAHMHQPLLTFCCLPGTQLVYLPYMTPRNIQPCTSCQPRTNHQSCIYITHASRTVSNQTVVLPSQDATTLFQTSGHSLSVLLPPDNCCNPCPLHAPPLCRLLGDTAGALCSHQRNAWLPWPVH